jgi:hypothetical protein
LEKPNLLINYVLLLHVLYAEQQPSPNVTLIFLQSAVIVHPEKAIGTDFFGHDTTD